MKECYFVLQILKKKLQMTESKVLLDIGWVGVSEPECSELGRL